MSIDTTQTDVSANVENTSAESSFSESEQALFNYLNNEVGQTGNEETVNDADSEVLEEQEEGSEPANSESSETKTETYRVKVNGVEKEVSKDELIAEYQKGVASQEKFEQAANLRKEAEAVRAKFESDASYLEAALGHFSGIVEQWQSSGMLTPPSRELLDNNPHEYLKQKAAFDERVNQIQQAQQAKHYLEIQRQELHQTELNKHLQQEHLKLPELLPEWKDEAKATAEQASLVKYLTGQGYSEADIEQLSYSRAANIALVVKAMRYDELKAKAAQPNKAQNPSKVVGSQPATNVSPSTINSKMKALKQSGSLDDAASVFADMFR